MTQHDKNNTDAQRCETYLNELVLVEQRTAPTSVRLMFVRQARIDDVKTRRVNRRGGQFAVRYMVRISAHNVLLTV